MRIAADGRFLQTNAIPAYSPFMQEIIVRLARYHSEHTFIFLHDTDKAPLINFPENITLVTITPAPNNFLLYRWWYDIKLSLLLKKHKADIFIGTDGRCSLTGAVPQLLIVSDLEFLHKPGSLIKNRLSFYRCFTRRFLKKAKVIATFSDFLKERISSQYAIPDQKITVIGNAADSSFKPLRWQEREKIKDQYAQGCEYFIFTGGLDPQKNILNLLKAFSIFKKWQKTNMKLVIAGNIERYKEQAEKLNTYKYKKELFFAENLTLNELANITAGAYAMIYPSLCEGFAMPILEAMQCEVPVITSANSSMTEIAGDAALYADPAKPEEIAGQMKHIFKDEQLRNKLAAAGKERAKLYNWDKIIMLTWMAVEKVVCG